MSSGNQTHVFWVINKHSEKSNHFSIPENIYIGALGSGHSWYLQEMLKHLGGRYRGTAEDGGQEWVDGTIGRFFIGTPAVTVPSRNIWRASSLMVADAGVPIFAVCENCFLSDIRKAPALG